MPGIPTQDIKMKRRVELSIRKNGFDENFIETCRFHLQKTLLESDPSKIKSREEYDNILMSNLFLNKLELFPSKRFKSQVNECTAWPVPLLPSELFDENTISVETRKYVFYQCLGVGDYLHCRVTASNPSADEYQLRVIHKYGITRILDDLNIMVTMRKADINDLPQVLREFELCQLLRVVVTEKEKKDDETKVSVSVKDNKTDLISFRPQLGSIPEGLIPQYVLNPYHSDRSVSYRDYLISNRGFYDPLLLNGIYEGFGINPRGSLSYYPANESLSSIDANVILKDSKLMDVKDYLEIALRDHDLAKFTFALAAINLAIKCYPKAENKKDKVELSKLHETRGTILASEKKKKMSLNGCKDWLKAANIDRTNNTVKVALSRAMSRVAIKYYKEKKYSNAAESASRALQMDEKNVEAHTLLEYLKKKHSGATTECEDVDESLLALLQKKKAIGSELKKLTGEAIPSIAPFSFDSSTSSSSSSFM